MGYSNSDWVKAITKIMELTSVGHLNWNLTSDYAEDQLETVLRAFEATKGDNRYVIKEVSYRYYLDEENYTWDTYHRFEIYQKIDGVSRERIATAPKMVLTSSLYAAIESNFAQARGVLDDLI